MSSVGTPQPFPALSHVDIQTRSARRDKIQKKIINHQQSISNVNDMQLFFGASAYLPYLAEGGGSVSCRSRGSPCKAFRVLRGTRSTCILQWEGKFDNLEWFWALHNRFLSEKVGKRLHNMIPKWKGQSGLTIEIKQKHGEIQISCLLKERNIVRAEKNT